jgi:hypothetical protein
MRNYSLGIKKGQQTFPVPCNRRIIGRDFQAGCLRVLVFPWPRGYLEFQEEGERQHVSVSS